MREDHGGMVVLIPAHGSVPPSYDEVMGSRQYSGEEVGQRGDSEGPYVDMRLGRAQGASQVRGREHGYTMG